MAASDTATESYQAPLRREGSRAEIFAWAMYDWSSSAFSTLLIVIVVMYTLDVVWRADAPATQATVAWLKDHVPRALQANQSDLGGVIYAYVIGGSMLLAAFASPIIGALADARATKHRWLIYTAVVGASAFCLMWLLDDSWAWTYVALFFLASLAFEISLGPYNGFLPEITTDQTINRVSAWGFGMGYIGGGLALLIAGLIGMFGGALGFPQGTNVTCDFNSTSDGEFAVALPAGEYQVRATLGDLTRRRDQMFVALEGQEFGPLDAAAGQTNEVEYAVAVNDGQLNVALRDAGGEDPEAALNGLSVVSQARGPEGGPLIQAYFDFGTYGSAAEPGNVWVSSVDKFREWNVKDEERLAAADGKPATHPAVMSFGWTRGEIHGADRRGPPRFRVGLLILGLWWGLFSIPTFVILRDAAPGDRSVSFATATRRAFGQVWTTIRHVRRYSMLALFLVAFLFFNDGMITVINQASVFANKELKFNTAELFGLVLMVQALSLPGALLVGYLSDKLGQRTVILGNLFIWIGLLTAALVITSKWQFWIMAAVLAMVMGGTQSVSRAMVGVMTPPQHTAEIFGFFNLSGKATSWLGNIIFGTAVAMTHNFRFAIFSLLVFFLVGIALTWLVDIERGKREITAAS